MAYKRAGPDLHMPRPHMLTSLHSGCGRGHLGPARLATLARQHTRRAQLVVNVPDSRYGFGDVFGYVLLLPALDGPGEIHFAALHLDFNLPGIDMRVLREPLADVLADALIGSLVPFGSAAHVRAGLRVLTDAAGKSAHSTDVTAVSATVTAPGRSVAALPCTVQFSAAPELPCERARTIVAILGTPVMPVRSPFVTPGLVVIAN